MSVQVMAPVLPYETRIRLVVLKLDALAIKTRLHAMDVATIEVVGPSTLGAELPDSGLWIAGLGHLLPHSRSESLYIVAAGG